MKTRAKIYQASLGRLSGLWYIVTKDHNEGELSEYLCRDGCIRTRVIQINTKHNIKDVLADSCSGYFKSREEAMCCCELHSVEYDVE